MTHPIGGERNINAPRLALDHPFDGDDPKFFHHPNADPFSPPRLHDGAPALLRHVVTPAKNPEDAWSTSAGAAHDCAPRFHMPIEEIGLATQVSEALAASGVIEGDVTSKKLDEFEEDILMVASTDEMEREDEVDPPPPAAAPDTPSKKRARAKAEAPEAPKIWFDHPRPIDVLFGRGGMTNSFEGNIWFGDEIVRVQENGRTLLEMYTSAKKHEKAIVARHLVNSVHQRGGRFLAKDKASGKWFEKPLVDAIEKAKQKIREYEVNASNRKTPHNHHNSHNSKKKQKAAKSKAKKQRARYP